MSHSDSSHRLPLLIVLIAAFMLVLWQAADLTRNRALQDLQRHIEADLGRYTLSLRKELEKYETLPELLATHQDVQRVLQASDDLLKIHRLNLYLEEVARITGASDIYLMGPTGLTLAASNWQQASSFIGRNFHFRPYFQEAIAGRPGRYHALGSTSKKRGYYFSYPVTLPGNTPGSSSVAGVMVVKVDLQDIEEQWSDPLVDLLVTDIDGVIFISTEPYWKFKTLQPLSQADRRRIISSQRYADQPLGALPVLTREPFDNRAELITLLQRSPSKPGLAGFSGNEYMLARKELADLELTAVAMARLDQVEKQVVNAMLLTGFLFVLVLLLLLFWIMRHRIQQERQRFREQTTRALQANEARIRAIIDNTQAGLITLSSQGRIQSFNPTAESLFGYSLAEVRGQAFEQLIAPADHNLYRQLLEHPATLAVEPPPLIETRGRHKHGGSFPVEMSLREIEQKGEHHLIVTLHDITERKEYEEHLRRARDELERRVEERTTDLMTSNERLRQEIEQHKQTQNQLIQTAKLAVLGQLSAGINHELNQPLAAIRAYADNARAFLRLGKHERAEENLGEIAGLTERMAKIIAPLKVFARQSAGQAEPVALQAVLDGALSILYPRLQNEAVEICRPDGIEETLVMGDMVRLEQVLVNLITNGLQAMADQPRKRLEISCASDQRGKIRLSVRDFGPGIAEEDLARVFEPFYTTKEVGQGLGLGLSISQRIVENLQGSLTAANHPEGGAVFTLTLPRPDRDCRQAS